ncbi:MAG TPA: lysophospholipid acyltransferase family protein, partial [Terriglobales bacterium]|nr:lysophospholipid acyltransferase family protein [Terriglobales bacterium]
TTADVATFSLRQRLALWLLSAAGTLLIRLIGPTLKYEVSIEEGGPPGDRVEPAIYVFWHRGVIPACYHFRGRDIAVMTSRSFDGEYIARIISAFGYKPVRGSSSRGGVRALLGMHTDIEQGRAVCFTIDGPRGPRYIAKPGPVLLARNTQAPIVAFHIACRAWVLNSWDRMIIPKPFSRALLRISALVRVPADGDSAALDLYHQQMQAALDRARSYADQHLPGSEAI